MKEMVEGMNSIVIIGFLAIGVFAVIEFYYRHQFKKHL
jgi:hypothetical protein